ncbi:protein SRC2-like [Bidens hawaiensis]|uniref:protein SRC2-like n=1 Tax=Bidens hawaiensis TaxID=980011 RepID=UPI004048FB27
MDYRTLDITILSTNGLTMYSSSGKRNHFYVTATISGTASPQRFKTTTNKNNGSDPTWESRMSFKVNINKAAHMELVVQVKATSMLFDKTLGEVRVSIKDLIEGVTSEGKTLQTVSYPVKGRSGEPQGRLSFSYKVGKIFTKQLNKAPPGYEYLGNMKHVK